MHWGLRLPGCPRHSEFKIQNVDVTCVVAMAVAGDSNRDSVCVKCVNPQSRKNSQSVSQFRRGPPRLPHRSYKYLGKGVEEIARAHACAASLLPTMIHGVGE